VLAAACAHARPPPSADDTPPASFVLGPDDVVEISVFREPDLTRTVTVRPDGQVSLPIAGEMQAAGRTPEDLRREVLVRLKDYVQDPTVVSVVVHEVRSARFYAVGEVVRPGDYPLRAGMTLLQGLALAGGPGEFSARTDVTVVRAGGKRLVVDLSSLLEGRGRVLLGPGDTLVVP